MNLIVSRYAEVLLTIAEAKIELGRLDEEMYQSLDMVRERAGMPKVNRIKYASKDKLRELVRRERRAEFAFEGLRRADIIRWDIAKNVLNGKAEGSWMGVINADESNEDKRLIQIGEPISVETRQFQPFNRYLPISQQQIDLNKNLTQTPGYN
ncbi:SusD family protein [compost metagenome]